jgi:hypothetical protein
MYKRQVRSLEIKPGRCGEYVDGTTTLKNNNQTKISKRGHRAFFNDEPKLTLKRELLLAP